MIQIRYEYIVDTPHLFLILTYHICLFQDDGNIRTYLTHKQKTDNMNNEDSDVDKNTDINVDMEIKIGKVSLNHDIPLSW